MPSDKKPLLLLSMLQNKCPACRKGRIFKHKSIFPLGECLTMVDNCTECGQKMTIESYKGGGINYALSMLLFFINFIWYWAIFGLSYLDYSVFYCLGTSTVVVILCQPFLMRLARALYLYMFVKYGRDINAGS